MNNLEQKVADELRRVDNINRRQTLYCTECCTHFRLSGENWVSGGKVADVIQDRLIVCTCGTALGVYAQAPIATGQVVPIH